MKKLFIFWIFLLGTVVLAKADDDKPIAVNELPSKALSFVNTHFTGLKISYAKVETDFFDKSYDVVFINGQKAEFDKKGEWKKVDCKYSSVPATILPDAIKKYLAEQYPGESVIEIERDKKGYEVKLKNKLELKFNKAFQLTEIDD